MRLRGCARRSCARARAEADGRVAEELIVVVDEAWRIFSHLGIGEWLQDSFKHSRAYGVQNLIVMHRLSELRAAGAEGSREARLAEGLLADTAGLSVTTAGTPGPTACE